MYLINVVFQGRLMTLVGKLGIGKTRTAPELATYAGPRSAQSCKVVVTRSKG